MFFFDVPEELSEKDYKALANAVYTVIFISKTLNNKIRGSMMRMDPRINILNSALAMALLNPEAAERILRSEWSDLRLIRCDEVE